MTAEHDSGEWPAEEKTSPDVLAQHPGSESGNGHTSKPPDDELRTQVGQLMGGHAELRRVVTAMRTDLQKLVHDAKERADKADDQHHLTIAKMRRMAATSPLVLVLAELIQYLLQHRAGH